MNSLCVEGGLPSNPVLLDDSEDSVEYYEDDSGTEAEESLGDSFDDLTGAPLNEAVDGDDLQLLSDDDIDEIEDPVKDCFEKSDIESDSHIEEEFFEEHVLPIDDKIVSKDIPFEAGTIKENIIVANTINAEGSQDKTEFFIEDHIDSSNDTIVSGDIHAERDAVGNEKECSVEDHEVSLDSSSKIAYDAIVSSDINNTKRDLEETSDSQLKRIKV